MTSEPPRQIDRLLRVMERLRDPDTGCPWDQRQDFASIAPYTIEEAYEVADAIARGDLPALRDELGDLLLQVVYHARMAEEAGHFAFNDVARAIVDKMIRRHPHVFGDLRVDPAARQSRHWEDHKAAERDAAGGGGRPAGALDGLPLALPALMRAAKLGRRAARAGFDWDAAPRVLEKVVEETAELRAEMDSGAGGARLAEELGDLLFACANLGRHLGVDPEDALRGASARFERRFRYIETELEKSGESFSGVGMSGLERLWQAAKVAGALEPDNSDKGQETDNG